MIKNNSDWGPKLPNYNRLFLFWDRDLNMVHWSEFGWICLLCYCSVKEVKLSEAKPTGGRLLVEVINFLHVPNNQSVSLPCYRWTLIGRLRCPFMIDTLIALCSIMITMLLLLVIINCENDLIHLMMSSMFWLGHFGLFHIFKIGYFGLVFNFAYETCKNSHT